MPPIDWPSIATLCEDRLIVIFFAFALNIFLLSRRFLMSLPSEAQPGYWIGQFMRNSERKLNRATRSRTARAIRGVMLTLFTCGCGLVAGRWLEKMAAGEEYGWLLDVAVLGTVLAWRLAYDTTSDLVYKEHDMSLYEARNTLSPLSDFDHEVMDEGGVFRHGAEAAVMTLNERVFGCALFYLLLGLPGLLFYYALHKLVQAVCYPHDHFRDFGQMAGVLFGILTLVPSVFTTVVLQVSAFFAPGSHPFKGFASLKPLMKLSPRFLPLHTTAVAADMQMGGAKRRRDWVIPFAWIGKGNPKPNDTHLRVVLKMMEISLLVFLGLLGLLYLQVSE